ncbi:hypothetical protein COX47_00420 [Candidatus Roizmanbacteria bacterium CG23_combo_of_CG06-09_8_20_14_all_35_49]|uniref:IrrE N-terminal-like domain-containing protein n=1 Tax=Candidatus Roizmanbacteria bacterium CG23_combo_of_CG06-09_8_20_14_all_35_49 TaxID=1974863 RepID=A0A2G9Y7V5_9BACT|nr:MAG: hypothetical protein COX47_00420 [Candidatus Roizmanbacteria bacterium CG23_combo_of_CG06-09_8_20_14_all_35_49]
MEETNKVRIAYARKKARLLLEEANIKQPPIILNTIIQHLKKTQPLSVQKWSFGDQTDGIQVTVGEKAVIGYNDDKHHNRKRFTVAHEIGHLILGHTQQNYDLENKSIDDTEANQFAAELLMPLEMLKNDIKIIKNVKDLAKKYVVSEEAMWIRLIECKLILKI